MVARNASRVDGKAVQVTKEKGKAQSNGKVKPATEKSILTSTATPEQIHQWVYLDRLSRMIDKNRPQDDPLRRMFYRAMHCPDNHMPAPATLDRLCKHLETMPEAERRAVFNGWRMGSMPHALEYWADELKIQNGLTFFRAGGDITACREEYPVASFDPIHVFIAEGATKEDAVGRLRAYADFLDRRWDEAITAEGKAYLSEPLNRTPTMPTTPTTPSKAMPAEPTPASDGEPASRLRFVRDWKGTEVVGYLVTGDDPNQPIALVMVDVAGSTGNVLDRAHSIAAEILADPQAIVRNAAPWGSVVVVDLRPYGRLDSTVPTPQYLYALTLQPVTADDPKPAADAPLTPFVPYCRFLHAHFNQKHVTAAPPAMLPDGAIVGAVGLRVEHYQSDSDIAGRVVFAGEANCVYRVDTAHEREKAFIGAEISEPWDEVRAVVRAPQAKP